MLIGDDFSTLGSGLFLRSSSLRAFGFLLFLLEVSDNLVLGTECRFLIRISLDDGSSSVLKDLLGNRDGSLGSFPCLASLFEDFMSFFDGSISELTSFYELGEDLLSSLDLLQDNEGLLGFNVALLEGLRGKSLLVGLVTEVLLMGIGVLERLLKSKVFVNCTLASLVSISFDSTRDGIASDLVLDRVHFSIARAAVDIVVASMDRLKGVMVSFTAGVLLFVLLFLSKFLLIKQFFGSFLLICLLVLYVLFQIAKA